MAEGATAELEMRRKQFKSQMSTVSTRRQQAVCVRKAYKRYGTKDNPYVILDGLNMTVPKGCIYGLLGASGCGKTTLLNCIVGRKRMNSGEIWVLGGTPGSRGSGVPGPRIGYMPQEIALYGEFSIRETLTYFGWISGMTTEEVEAKLSFYIDFLMLPDADRMVKNLSGGQQRRVSLAATLIHEPELLILDEPTVGVDPLLRANIWNYLVDITKGGRTTVIITTHYIDETRQAHLIGLMRGGYFLAEESPERLITQFGCDSLEDVFLKLSVMQNRGKRRRSSILQGVTEAISVPSGTVNDAVVLDDEVGEISGEFGDNVSMSSRGGIRPKSRVSIAPEPTEIAPPELPPEEAPPAKWTDYLKVVKEDHMKALIWKNFLWMWRNAPVMAFIIGLPVIQTILFCYSIGHDPKGITLSIINHEINYPSEQCSFQPGCNTSRLSCNFLSQLENQFNMSLTYYDTEDKAHQSVVDGNSWAMLVVKENFSEALKNRVELGKEIPSWDLKYSTIQIHADKSNENIATFITRDALLGFVNFFTDYLKSCDISPSIASLPMRFDEALYGSNMPDFTNFAAPGVIITIIYFMAVALTSGGMLMERNEGILERSLVNGITGMEILFSHVITQFVVMVGQTAFVLAFAFGFYHLEQNGSWTLITLLTLLAGLCGMCFGFVVACACDNERSATYMALGSFLPIVMLCGIVWPIESMNQYLKYVSFVLPLTQATDSMRCIISRGWGIENPVVYEGFISIVIWILIFLTLSILVLKFKKG